ncbi:type II secretion system minor pseudopilin GspJ [Pseudomonas sp. RL]|uniref:type II secretion system minor pseudopilin GspJ n=1 Tax=Pseudomonas sp. RL TaxID=1452718 RepID=UPI0004804DC4|nr:type II secretion system minor pseudopilin GspJ [Pseudomonas sp. RL]
MRAARGFTLLELLIAIALFALLGVGTYRLLDSVLRVDEATRQQEQRLRELTRGMAAFERDLRQVLARPVRAPYGDSLAALLGEGRERQTLEFTRTGWRNPTDSPRSRLQRVRWEVRDGYWERRYWPVLDQAQDSQPQVQQVLDGVSGWQVRYLDQDGNWQDSWPGGVDEQSLGSLPRAVELRLEHRHYGVLRRLFRLPDTDAGSEAGA